MTLLDELAPQVDIDTAFDSFLRRRNRRRRRRARLHGASVAVTVALVAAVIVAATGSTTHDPTIQVSEPSTSAPPARAPRYWPTPQAAIDAYLHANPTYKERGRVKFDQNTWILIAENIPTGERGSAWTVGTVQFPRSANGWAPGSAAIGGMIDRCFSPLEGGYVDLIARLHGRRIRPPLPPPDYVFAVTADPSWRVQVLLNSRWTTLHTTKGVYFKIHPQGALAMQQAGPPRQRPITADGHVPRCVSTTAAAPAVVPTS